MSTRVVVLLLALLCAVAVSEARVSSSLKAKLLPTAVADPPLITGVTDCGYSLETACRANNRMQVTGLNFPTGWPGINSVSIGGVSGLRYPCTSSYANVATIAFCFIPDIDPRDQGQPLTVRISSGPANDTIVSNDYEGVYLTGALSIDSISGCSGSERGFPTDCQVGDSITLQGTGFGYAQPGADNPLLVQLMSGVPVTDVQVLSNNQLSCTLPLPFQFASFISLFAGKAPQAYSVGAVTYAPVPLVNALYPVSGCNGSKGYRQPLLDCHSGDVIDVGGAIGGFVGPLSKVTIGSYECGSPVFNATQTGIRCTLPQVDPLDRGVPLPVAVFMQSGDVSNAWLGVVYATGLGRMQRVHAHSQP